MWSYIITNHVHIESVFLIKISLAKTYDASLSQILVTFCNVDISDLKALNGEILNGELPGVLLR